MCTTGLVHVGKGRRHCMSTMQMQGVRGVCALRALVYRSGPLWELTPDMHLLFI